MRINSQTFYFYVLFFLSLFLKVSILANASNVENEGNSFLEETKDEYIFSNTSSRLVVNKLSLKIKLLDAAGKEQYSDFSPAAFYVNSEWIAAEGSSEVKSLGEKECMIRISGRDRTSDFTLWIQSVNEHSFRVKIKCSDPGITKIRGTVKLNPVEEIYGFGEMWNGSVHQRGKSFDLWVKGGTPDECAYMPYFVSTNNYAFFLNYGGMVSFDVGKRKSDELVYESTANEFDITLVSGASLSSAVQNFLAITGLPAKPPRWTFQPWFWLMGDPDQPGAPLSTLKGEHFPGMINKLLDLNIPVGVTWLEPPWQDARTSFIPNKEFSPDLKKLIDEISALGVKTLAWTVPYTLKDASNWKEAVEKGYLVRKPSGKKLDENYAISASGELENNFYTYIDFLNPEAFKWWQGQIEKSLDLGIRGYKLDDGQHLPADAILHGGLEGRDVHNSYSLEYNRVFFNALTKKYGEDFLMVPRAAWVGSTSYTNFKWPGDLSGSFANNGLPSSVYSSLSLAFSGMPFVSTDIGGFATKPSPEPVWIRWAQFGAFLPGMQTLHMPWWYSKEAMEHYRYLAWLHTELTPYWMTLANEAHQTGTPICRPLVWNYQDDIDCWRADDQFTVGDYIMVAPFMNTNNDREVYIPEGTWLEFWDEKQIHTGPKKTTWFKGYGEKGRWTFPLYIKEGAVIPMEVVNDVTGFGWTGSEGFVTLAMWPEYLAENEYILNDQEQVMINTNWDTKNRIRISWTESVKDYMFRIHLRDGKTAGQVFSGKTTLQQSPDLNSFQQSSINSWFFDEKTRKLWVRMVGDDTGEITINLRN